MANKKEKSIGEQVRSDVTMLEEITSLKRQIGGYKTANENYKKQVAELKERVEHYKALDLEGDRLYEDKIAELDDAKAEIERLRNMEEKENTVPKRDYDELEKSVEKKKAFIEQLQERVQELMIERSNLQRLVKTRDDAIKELEDTVDELSKPWWKKIF